MLTKLTLTIEQSVIEQAKEYAKKKKRSVSRIVEEYLQNIAMNRNSSQVTREIKSPITESIYRYGYCTRCSTRARTIFYK